MLRSTQIITLNMANQIREQNCAGFPFSSSFSNGAGIVIVQNQHRNFDGCGRFEVKGHTKMAGLIFIKLILALERSNQLDPLLVIFQTCSKIAYKW